MSRRIIAILRGIAPVDVVSVWEALISMGIDRIAVPLNSPEPFDGIGCMVETAGARAVIGAGTVRDVRAVDRLVGIGACIVVPPDCNPEVIRATKAAGMLSYPGGFALGHAVGATGFGIGTGIYTPCRGGTEVTRKAAALVAAWDVLRV